MENEMLIERAVKDTFNAKVLSLVPLGKGAAGSAFLAEISHEPKTLAVKVSCHGALLEKEKAQLDFLGAKACYKVPKTYGIYTGENSAVLFMEYISGTPGSSKKLLLMPQKSKLADSIIDELVKTQHVHGKKYGKFDNPVYDTWKEYYTDFFREILAFSRMKAERNALKKEIVGTLEQAGHLFDVIFSVPTGAPCPCHGDFWSPNMIIDTNNKTLAGLLDPFDSLWAEPEYELFALTLGLGKTLHLYDKYKSRVRVSEYCDLKTELYALVNELHWYKQLGSVGHGYLSFRAKRLNQQLRQLTAE